MFLARKLPKLRANFQIVQRRWPERQIELESLESWPDQFLDFVFEQTWWLLFGGKFRFTTTIKLLVPLKADRTVRFYVSETSKASEGFYLTCQLKDINVVFLPSNIVTKTKANRIKTVEHHQRSKSNAMSMPGAEISGLLTKQSRMFSSFKRRPKRRIKDQWMWFSWKHLSSRQQKQSSSFGR